MHFRLGGEKQALSKESRGLRDEIFLKNTNFYFSYIWIKKNDEIGSKSFLIICFFQNVLVQLFKCFQVLMQVFKEYFEVAIGILDGH